MAQDETVLVATVVHPERRFRIPKPVFDKVNSEAKEAGSKSPFIEQEEDCEGGPSFDQLDDAGQEEVTVNQEKRQAKIDADDEADDE